MKMVVRKMNLSKRFVNGFIIEFFIRVFFSHRDCYNKNK